MKIPCSGTCQPQTSCGIIKAIDASTKTESAKAFSRNLLILAYAIAGKAVLALALALLTSNYAISEIASMAALLIAVAVLTKASAFRLDPAEVENEGDGVTLLRSTTESMRSIAASFSGRPFRSLVQ